MTPPRERRNFPQLIGSLHILWNMQIDYFATWTRLFTADALPKLAAAAVSVAAMWCTLNLAKHRLAFPAVLLSIPAIFHVVRLALGMTLQEAADTFWCSQPEVSPALVPAKSKWTDSIVWEVLHPHNLSAERHIHRKGATLPFSMPYTFG